MKFVFLHHGDPLRDGLWSGIPRNIVMTLQQMGHDVTIVDKLKPESKFRFRVRTAIYRYLLRKIYVMNRDPRILKLRTKPLIGRLKAVGNADAILVTFPSDAAFLRTEIPIVVIHDATYFQLLDYYPGYERKDLSRESIEDGVDADRRALMNSSRIIYSSQWAAKSAVNDYGIEKSKISVVPFGANLKNAPTDEELGRYLDGRGTEAIKLFFLGKEWYRKGGDIAVAIASEIKNLGFPVELHVVGCTPLETVPSFVKIYGLLNKEIEGEANTIWNLFKSSDYFVLPTRADAFGIVFAEAAAFGLPIMTTDTGGVKEVMKEDWGLALPTGTDVKVYARWAVENFHDRSKYKQLAWNARKDYTNRLNWHSFCQSVEAILNKDLGRHV